MCETLTSIAWADNEKCWTIVQHKEADINLSIVSNIKTISDLVGKLHSREVTIQQELLEEYAETWGEVLEKMANSCLSWLEKRYVSATYLDPPERKELVASYIERLMGAMDAMPTGSEWRQQSAKGFCKTWGGNVQSLLDLVDSLAVACEGRGKWPTPGGVTPTGWLATWCPHKEVTTESLQIAKVEEPSEERATPAVKIDEWRTVARVFSSQLVSLQAEFLTRAIINEQELNKKAATDHAVVVSDLQAILLDATTFPCPKPVLSEDVVVLVDCLDTSVTLKAHEGGVAYTAGDRSVRLLSLRLTTEAALWGDMLCLHCTIDDGSTQTDVLHTFPAGGTELGSVVVARLQRLLDSHDVGHNFENETLLGSHMAECDEMVAEIRKVQDQLHAYIFTSDTGACEDGDTPWAVSVRRAREISEPQQQSLNKESGVFLKYLQHAMQEQMWLFDVTIMSTPSSLIPILKGAGLFLLHATSEFTRVLKAHEENYMVLHYDYTDEDNGYETRFKDLLKKICESPDKAQTTEHFKEAVSVLHDIEHAYKEVRSNKEECLDTLQKEVGTVTEKLLDELCAMLNLGRGAQDEQSIDIEGVAFAVLDEPRKMQFGEKDENSTAPPPRPQSPLRREKPPEPESPPHAEADPKKGKKKGKEPTHEEPVPVEDDTALADMLKVKERVTTQLEPLKRDLFLLENSKNAILTSLREQLVRWFLKYSASIKHAAEVHKKQTVTELEAWLNAKLRGHQRRVPSLASKEYDGRIRELVETDEKKHREFTWIGQRFTQALEAAKLEMQNKQAAFEKEMQHLSARKAGLPGSVNIAALGAHKKQTENEQDTIAEKITTAALGVNQMLDLAKKTMAKEGKRYLEDHCKTFAEGGLMSEEEVAKNKEAIAAMNTEAQDTIVKLRNQVTEIKKQQETELEKERKAYQAAHQESTDDLNFIKWQNEALVMVKGKMNLVVSSSAEEEKKLEVQVAALEEMVKTLLGRADGALGEGAQGEAWGIDINPVVTNILRKAKLGRDSKLRETVAFKLVALVDTLSRLVHKRGMQLGCLVKHLAFHDIGPQTYFTKKALETEELKDDTLKVDPLLTIAEKLVADFWSDGGKVAQYYKSLNGRTPTRGEHISATEALHKEYLTNRLEDIKAQLTAHIAAATPEYKKQVIKISLAVPRVPHQVFTSLYNNALCMADDSVGGCRRLFDGMQAVGMQRRREHTARVKGCMVNPGNRELIISTDKAELSRQQTSRHILDQFQGILLREEANVYHLFTQQVTNVTATLFRALQSLVAPSMIVTGSDVMVGDHRSLKRLRIAKQRKDTQAAQQAASPLARKKSDKDAKGKGKPTKGKESPAADGRLTTVYPGLPVLPRNPFAEYVEQHQGVVIMDHLGEAKPVEEVKKVPSKTTVKKGKAPVEAAPVEDAQQTPPVEGPEEPIFVTVIQQRGQAYDAFVKMYGGEIEKINGSFEEMKADDAKWIRNWSDLVDSLMPKG
eukprot:TRINITY_DN1671_c0_g1_i4.p1 TRINITY_DN1671_c0_g1~~TRINITY_DN1671_c0_g1_i4.p1  ORF type:complete len:1636 (+),score=598.81 TRINITY_DN1671_c0_g1_i4:473-4909(+)